MDIANEARAQQTKQCSASVTSFVAGVDSDIVVISNEPSEIISVASSKSVQGTARASFQMVPAPCLTGDMSNGLDRACTGDSGHGYLSHNPPLELGSCPVVPSCDVGTFGQTTRALSPPIHDSRICVPALVPSPSPSMQDMSEISTVVADRTTMMMGRVSSYIGTSHSFYDLTECVLTPTFHVQKIQGARRPRLQDPTPSLWFPFPHSSLPVLLGTVVAVAQTHATTQLPLYAAIFSVAGMLHYDFCSL